MLHREQMIYDFKVIQIIDGGKVYKVVEIEAGGLVEEATDIIYTVAINTGIITIANSFAEMSLVFVP